MTSPNFEEAAQKGHILRSKYLDAFAPVEVWATSRARGLLGEKLKPNTTFSVKLKAIRADANSACSKFRNPKDVVPLLDEVAWFAELRAHLVHSKLTTAVSDDGSQFWLFKNSGQIDLPSNKFSTVQNADSLNAEIQALLKIGRKLEKQELKA